LTLQIRDLLLGIRDLLFGVRDLLFALGYFAAEFFILSMEPFVLPMEFFPAGLLGVPMTIRRCLSLPGAASRSRTHPPYVKRFRSICPTKSLGHLNCC
jgi:hypothetical protein